MKAKLVLWVEEYFYAPKPFQKFLSFLLIPLSWIYCFVMWSRYKLANAEDLGIEVVSVGNLHVGGSGKTPFVIALAQNQRNIAIILRGYGRESQGMIVVKHAGEILCDVAQSGDEAMIYAQKLPFATVIVSEDRKKAIHHAKELGLCRVILDDGYSKHMIKKKDILLSINTSNQHCLPAGAFRERLWKGKQAYIAHEDTDFFRHVTLQDATPRMVLVTAIARPQRLDKYLPEVVGKYYFEDHHSFTKEELETILKEQHATSLLVTLKDYVKIEQFGLPVSLLDLDITLSNEVINFVAFE